MKKFLTALLAVVMIASMASLAAFAADEKPTMTAGDVTVEVGSATVTVPFDVVNVPADQIAALKFRVKYDEALTIASNDRNVLITNRTDLSNEQWGPCTNNPIALVWVGGTETLPGDVNLGSIVFTLPEDAKVGDVYELIMELTLKDA